MFAAVSESGLGQVSVATTTNKGHDPEFWAQAISDRVVSVGGNCHPVIAEQAEGDSYHRLSEPIQLGFDIQ